MILWTGSYQLWSPHTSKKQSVSCFYLHRKVVYELSWLLGKRYPRYPETTAAPTEVRILKNSNEQKPKESLLLGEEEDSPGALMAQREKDVGLEDANLEGGYAFENSMDPCPSLVP